MMANGIAFTAAALLSLPARVLIAPKSADGGINKTAAMRCALRAAGRDGMDAASLATTAGLDNTGLVRALLKYDIAKERVSFIRGRYYVLDDSDGDPA